MISRNHEGYNDPTANLAISRADRRPSNIGQLMDMYRTLADLCGLEIVGRITFKDKKTGIEYR